MKHGIEIHISRRDIIDMSKDDVLLHRILQSWRSGELTFEESLKLYTVQACRRIKDLEDKLLDIEMKSIKPIVYGQTKGLES
jgi:hypothetical protein